MKVEVVFLPAVATDLSSKLFVVIDVLRATSTLVSMFDAGVERVILSETVSSALAYAERCSPRPLVCGESGGLRPTGFDLGNSPREFRSDVVGGSDLVFCTSNGTRAMQRLAESPVVLAGSLLNASALVRTALSEARGRGLDLALVCSGDYHGTKFAIDDAFCAGYLVTVLQREVSGSTGFGPNLSNEADGGLSQVEFTESAVAASRLVRSYLLEAGMPDAGVIPPKEVILKAFWESHNAQVLRRVGLSEDVEYCAQVDISAKVPRLQLSDGRLVLL